MTNRLLLIFVVLLFGCSDDPIGDCDGFSGEPSIQFKASTNDTLGILFINNRGIGDTAFAFNGGLLSIPIDMNSDTMFYDVLGDSNLGRLVLAYTLEQQFCETADELKQHFRSAKFTPQSTFFNIKSVIDGSATPLDTNAGYGSFLNQTRTERYFEVAM